MAIDKGSQGACCLVLFAYIDSVLEFRNQKTLQKTNAQLQRIAEHEAQETKAMSEITTLTYKDSRTSRIATVIALIYLPVSIVLVSESFLRGATVNNLLVLGLSK